MVIPYTLSAFLCVLPHFFNLPGCTALGISFGERHSLRVCRAGTHLDSIAHYEGNLLLLHRRRLGMLFSPTQEEEGGVFCRDRVARSNNWVGPRAVPFVGGAITSNWPSREGGGELLTSNLGVERRKWGIGRGLVQMLIS